MGTDDAELRELLEQLDPTSKLLVAEVDLGLQARDFMRSDLGRHLVGCLQQEMLLAQEALSKTFPWRWRRISELQTRIWRAQFMLSWLRELLVSGRAAESAANEVSHED